MPDIRRWSEIRPDIGYPALEISRISVICYPAEKVFDPTIVIKKRMIVSHEIQTNPMQIFFIKKIFLESFKIYFYR